MGPLVVAADFKAACFLKFVRHEDELDNDEELDADLDFEVDARIESYTILAESRGAT